MQENQAKTFTTEQLFIQLLRTVLCNEPLPMAHVTFDEFKQVIRLASRHDLAHMAYVAFERADCLPTPETDERATPKA